jgi:hypothetical protein
MLTVRQKDSTKKDKGLVHLDRERTRFIRSILFFRRMNIKEHEISLR